MCDKTYEFGAGAGAARKKSGERGARERDTAGIYIQYDGYEIYGFTRCLGADYGRIVMMQSERNDTFQRNPSERNYGEEPRREASRQASPSNQAPQDSYPNEE